MSFIINMITNNKIASILSLMCFTLVFILMSNMSMDVSGFFTSSFNQYKLMNSELQSIVPNVFNDDLSNYVKSEFDEEGYFYAIDEGYAVTIDQDYYNYLVDNNQVDEGYNAFGVERDLSIYYQDNINYTDSCSGSIYIGDNFIDCNDASFVVVDKSYFTEDEYFKDSLIYMTVFNTSYKPEKMQDLEEVGSFKYSYEIENPGSNFKLSLKINLVYVLVALLTFILTLYVQSFLCFIKNQRDFRVLTLLGKSKFKITLYITSYTLLINLVAVLIATKFTQYNLTFLVIYILVSTILIHIYSIILIYVFKISDIERIG